METKKRKMAVLSIIALMLLAFLACQPTPDEDNIAQKNSDAMLEMAKTDTEGTDTESLRIPNGNYTYEAFDASGTVHVKVDASVIVPNVEHLSIARVHPLSFTEADVIALSDALLSGTVTIANDGPKFKAYWESVLSGLVEQRQSGELGKYDTVEQLDDAIQEIIQKIAEEPAEPIACPPDFSFKGSGWTTRAEICGVRNNLLLSKLMVINPNNPDFSGTGANVHYIRSVHNYSEFSGLEKSYSSRLHWSVQQNKVNVITPALDKDAALAAAQQVMSTAKLTDYTCAGIRITPIFSMINDKVKAECKSAYEVLYTRNINGVQETYTNEAVACEADDMDATSVAWPYEKIRIFVDDEGIYAFLWQGPCAVELLNKQATLLPFEQIKIIFEEKFMLKHGNHTQDASMAAQSYAITKICLGLARISERDNLTAALLVPVWDFFGTYTDGHGNVDGLDGYDSWFTINAIDGTVIDRSLGY